MPSGNRLLTTGLHSGIRSSEPNCRLIPPRSSLLHTCSRRSRCPTSASHSSRPTVELGACGLELPATCRLLDGATTPHFDPRRTSCLKKVLVVCCHWFCQVERPEFGLDAAPASVRGHP